MKKLLTIIIGWSLALAGGAMAQQDDATPANKKKKQQQAEQGAAQQSQPGANEGRHNQQAQPDHQAKPGKEAHPKQNHKAKPHEHVADNAPAENNNAASRPTSASDTSAETNAQGKNAANGIRHGKQMKKEPNAANKTADDGTATTSTNAETSASTAAQVGAGNRPAKTAKDRTKKPDPEVVQKVKTEHANFKAQARPEKVPAVTFNESYRISGAQQWQGSQYEVFRAYRPARHDHGWYHSHYPRIEIIAGGAYYFNNGYWFPAWGYNPSYQYYAYDAPIYVGSQALPPDRVIADVQSILQQEGYYKGEVDGLLGPLTREALIEYQADNGLYTTATIDEPTLQSLDLG